MNSIDVRGDRVADFVQGTLDVVFAFAVTLERKGLLSRSDLAEMLSTAQEQQAERDRALHPARAGVIELMRQAFDMPVAGEQARARFRVIEGGSD